MFQLSKVYMVKGEPATYVGEQAGLYVFDFLNKQGTISFVPDDAQDIKEATAVPKRPAPKDTIANTL